LRGHLLDYQAGGKTVIMKKERSSIFNILVGSSSRDIRPQTKVFMKRAEMLKRQKNGGI
jgi:hypothetical protein